jgi:hypothetical protein
MRKQVETLEHHTNLAPHLVDTPQVRAKLDALMQRISVDFPEPDGPQITMRSPRETSRSMSRST